MNDTAIESLISNSQFFAGLDPAHLEFLARSANRRQVAAGQVLFHQGDPASTFYLIERGRVSVEVPAIQGPELIVQTVTANQVLGWSWLIAPYRWTFMARAEEPVDLIEFDGKAVLARCESDPAFGYSLLKRFSALMSERLAHARQRMIDEWSAAGFA
jgi:CRP-like cAMP-binding protein